MIWPREMGANILTPEARWKFKGKSEKRFRLMFITLHGLMFKDRLFSRDCESLDAIPHNLAWILQFTTLDDLIISHQNNCAINFPSICWASEQGLLMTVFIFNAIFFGLCIAETTESIQKIALDTKKVVKELPLAIQLWLCRIVWENIGYDFFGELERKREIVMRKVLLKRFRRIITQKLRRVPIWNESWIKAEVDIPPGDFCFQFY